MTDIYLNAGFGEPLSDEDLSLIASLGYVGIRQNVPDPAEALPLVSNVLNTKLRGIFIVPVDDPDNCQATAHAIAEAAVALGSSGSVTIEVGNEEDLHSKTWSKKPERWAALVNDVVQIALQHWAGGVQVVSGGISSLSREAVGWLIDSGISDVMVDAVGYHQYRSTTPDVPLKGYGSRDEEFRALRTAAGPHQISCTETGWSTAPRNTGWPFKRDWSYNDNQVLNFMVQEWVINNKEGALAFVQYQLNDGPDPDNDQDRFGIRATDGTLKPQSRLPKI
jgi:hypothetical protein